MEWSWRGRPYLDDLREALQPFGLFVYEHPGYENMDQFGYLVSDCELSEAELKEIQREFWDDGTDDEDL